VKKNEGTKNKSSTDHTRVGLKTGQTVRYRVKNKGEQRNKRLHNIQPGPYHKIYYIPCQNRTKHTKNNTKTGGDNSGGQQTKNTEGGPNKSHETRKPEGRGASCVKARHDYEALQKNRKTGRGTKVKGTVDQGIP